MARIDQDTRFLIIQKYCSEGLSCRNIAKLVKKSKSAVYQIIRKYGEHHTLGDLPRSRTRSGAANPQIEKKCVKLLLSDESDSVRQIAKKLKVSVGTVQNIKRRNNIKTYKKQKVPKRSAEQHERAKERCRTLDPILRKRSNCCILMDDETYCKLDTTTLPGPQFFNAIVGEEVPDDKRSIKMDKFGKKVLVWQAICSCGKKSLPYFTTGTINAENYRKECIQKRLVVVYRQHKTPPLFWPDLASAHYAATTLKLLKKYKIKFVEKANNPPNCPELRPIERYWAIIKRYLRKDGREAQSIEEFKKMWSSASRKVKPETVKTLMKGIRGKVRQFYH